VSILSSHITHASYTTKLFIRTCKHTPGRTTPFDLTNSLVKHEIRMVLTTLLQREHPQPLRLLTVLVPHLLRILVLDVHEVRNRGICAVDGDGDRFGEALVNEVAALGA